MVSFSGLGTEVVYIEVHILAADYIINIWKKKDKEAVFWPSECHFSLPNFHNDMIKLFLISMALRKIMNDYFQCLQIKNS